MYNFNISDSNMEQLSTGKLILVYLNDQLSSSFPFEISSVTIKKGKISRFQLKDTDEAKVINLFVNKSASNGTVKFEKPGNICFTCGAHLGNKKQGECVICKTKYHN